MFQDGVKKTILSNSVRLIADKQPSTLTTHFRRAQPRLTHTKTQRPLCKQSEKYDSVSTGFLRFPFSNFRYSLTLFSKFFASFPHGTCTLSVSHQYLALDGIYHPLRAAIPNNSTRRRSLDRPGGRESHPLGCPVPRDLARPVTRTTLDHNSAQSADSQRELVPLQSPLLRESWLVSFPPLNYMLKFSGSSYLS